MKMKLKEFLIALGWSILIIVTGLLFNKSFWEALSNTR